MAESFADLLIPLLAGLPDEAAVTLPVGWLRARLRSDGSGVVPDPLADLSCAEVGAALGRSPSTIRAWCTRGDMPGAYRLRQREWRIPRASLRRYLDQQATGAESHVAAEPVDLTAWRQHYRTR
jgi:hypothetical protein